MPLIGPNKVSPFRGRFLNTSPQQKLSDTLMKMGQRDDVVVRGKMTVSNATERRQVERDLNSFLRIVSRIQWQMIGDATCMIFGA